MSNSIVTWSQVLLVLMVSSTALAEPIGNTGLTKYEGKQDETSIFNDLEGAGAVRSLLRKKKKCPKKCPFAGQICSFRTRFECKCRGQLQPKTITQETIIKRRRKTIIKKTTIKTCACLVGKQVGFSCVLPTPPPKATPSPVVG